MEDLRFSGDVPDTKLLVQWHEVRIVCGGTNSRLN